MTKKNATVDELRDDLTRTRSDLGGTVSELAERTDTTTRKSIRWGGGILAGLSAVDRLPDFDQAGRGFRHSPGGFQADRFAGGDLDHESRRAAGLQNVRVGTGHGENGRKRECGQ